MHNLTMNLPCSTGNEMFLRLGYEAQEGLRQQRAQMVHEQRQLVEEGEAQKQFVRRQMESEQRAYLMILESVSQESDIVRQEAQHLRDNFHRTEQSLLLPTSRPGRQQTCSRTAPVASVLCCTAGMDPLRV